MKKYLLITLMLGILVPGVAGAMRTKLNSMFKNYNAINKSLNAIERYEEEEKILVDFNNAIGPWNKSLERQNTRVKNLFNNVGQSFDSLPKCVFEKLKKKHLEIKDWKEILESELKTWQQPMILPAGTNLETEQILEPKNLKKIVKPKLTIRQQRIITLAPVILAAGTGLAAIWYFWKTKPVKAVKSCLSRTLASWFYRK